MLFGLHFHHYTFHDFQTDVLLLTIVCALPLPLIALFWLHGRSLKKQTEAMSAADREAVYKQAEEDIRH